MFIISSRLNLHKIKLAIMKTVTTHTYYLEMKTNPNLPEVELPDEMKIIEISGLPANLYRNLYRAVGSDWNWFKRAYMPDAELLEILDDPKVELYEVYINGLPAGFAELDRREVYEVELAYFGLMKDFMGKGYGKLFMKWLINLVWTYNPERFWLHTCDDDSPAALPFYLKSGFVVYKDEMVEDEVLEAHETLESLNLGAPQKGRNN